MSHIRHKRSTSVNVEGPDHTIHVGEARNESPNHAIHSGVGHVELINEKTVVRHRNQITGTLVVPKTVNVEKRQVQTLNQITQQGQKPPSCNTICAGYAPVLYPQVIDLQEAQKDAVNCRDDVQLNTRISARDGNRRTGYSGHEATSAKGRQVEIANRATEQAPKQHIDNMVHAEHALADHSDQVTMPHAPYGGEECLQQTNGSVAMHSKGQSGHLIDARSINVEERYVEPMKQVMQEAEEQLADYISHTTQMHIGPPSDGVFRHGNKKIGSGAALSSSRDKQKWTMPTEQLISDEEQEHTHAIDATQAEHIEADTGKEAPGRTQKRKKKGLMVFSNNGLQLRRSKRLAPESDAVVDTGPLQIESPEQQAASPYQNLSDLPNIDGIIANICPGSSPQLEMPQLRSTELETLHSGTSPASNPYLESHNEIIVEHDMHETRSEVEPRLVYKGQGKTGPPKLCVPIEQELEHPGGNIQTEKDEFEMGQQTVRLTHKRTKRSLMPSSYEGFEHRRSKRLAKQSTAVTYYESAESESEEHQAASPSQNMSDSPDNDQVSDDISSSPLPQHDMPQRSTNEADNLHVTTQSASSIPDMSDPESFARYYSKIYPSEVRRALERSPNLWLERLIHQNPSSYLHAGDKEKKRRGRGRTLCLKVWTMPEGVRIPITLNYLGQPIGNEAATLSSFLGTLARDGTIAPLTFSDWRRFPEKNKDVMWHIVNLKFVIAPIGEVWAMKTLGKKWKDWKAILKHERYDAHETDQERLADRDSRVPEEQWKFLVAYWGTEKAKAASARCRASQAQQPLGRHRTGSKSYARIREEERQKRPNKEEPSRTDIFILTHTPKDGKGKPIDKATADVISRLREEAQKRREGSASDSMDDVFAKVIGPDTRDMKRTYGPVLCTNELRGKTAAKVSLRQAMEAKRKAEEEADTLREKMMEMEENNRKLQADLANAKNPASSGMKERRISTDGRQKK